MDLAVFCLLGFILHLSSAFPCQYISPKPYSATFDLSPLTRNSTAYFARDSDATDPFFYQFNVCENLAQLPNTDPSTVCQDPDNHQKLYPAYQIVNASAKFKQGACFAIGSLVSPSWSFINENDESIGVQLTYNGGWTEQCPQNRKFMISFRCAHACAAYRRHISTVYEDTLCEYWVDFYSIYACPQECFPHYEEGEGDDSVCSGNGLCSIDEDIQSARCFCYQGKGGRDCSMDTSGALSSANPNTVLIAIIFTLLALIVLLAVVLAVKIRKLQSDDSNYGRLKEESVVQSSRDASLPSTVP